MERISSTAGSANLSVTITATPNPVAIGGALTYTYTVANQGPSGAHGVVLTLSLSDAVSLVSTPITGCALAGRSLTCPLGDLAANGQIRAQVTVAPSVEGTLTTNAQVAASESDPDSTDNSFVLNTNVGTTTPSPSPSPSPNPNPNPTPGGGGSPTVGPQADLAVTLSDHPDPAMVNGRLIHILTALNDGPDPATGVTASMALPNGLAYVSASEGCSNTAGSVVCTFPDLPRGSQAARAIVTSPTASGQWIATALVGAREFDRESADNTATATTTVVTDRPSADLAVTLKAAPKKVRLGKNLTYTAKVQNLRKKGSARQADGVVAILELPGGFSVLTASRGCLVAGTIATCELGTLRRGAARTLKIVGRPGSAGALTAGVRVTGGVNDRNLRNNSRQVRTAAR